MGSVRAIKKTMIFVNSISKGIEIIKYLQILLPAKLQDKIQLIICL